MKRFSLLQFGVFTALCLAAFNPVLKADQYDRKTVISISQPLEVPGVVLPPGTYVMKLFNSSSNRHIVQFMNADQNRQLALTFAVSAERIRPAEKTLLTMYEGSRESPPALRTWFYPGDTVGQEFLYPHRQAVRISERANAIVPEVEAGKTASSETAAAVTPAEQPQNNEPRSEVLIARAEPAPAPAPEPVAAPEPIAAPEPQQPAAEPQAPAAQSAQTPAAPTAEPESLPQTASNAPLAALIGTLAFALACGMQQLRRRRIL